MDKKQISQITQSPTGKALFRYFASRERNPKDGMMDVRRAKYAVQEEGVEVVPREFIENFRAMEKAGLGKLIEASGKPARFKWAVDMKKVATEALRTDGKGSQAGSAAPSAPTIEIAMMLGPDREASVSIPADITEKEAEFLFNTILRRMRK